MEKGILFGCMVFCVEVVLCFCFCREEESVSRPIISAVRGDTSAASESADTIPPYSIYIFNVENYEEVIIASKNDSCYKVALEILRSEYDIDFEDTTVWKIRNRL